MSKRACSKFCLTDLRGSGSPHCQNHQPKKDLEHGQSEVVVILASSCQLICILAKVSCQLFKVLSRVLTWEPGLDDGLEIFKPLNGGGLDGLEELEPNNWEGVRIIQLLSHLIA
ncbi:hypothetical protein MHU86_4659 [Fragilaria crotonensis]|nr:hypothetical protein MHU86_4659 [Fragilaria crotonensis]